MDESINNQNNSESENIKESPQQANESKSVGDEAKPTSSEPKNAVERGDDVIEGKIHQKPNRRLVHASRSESFSGPIPPPALLDGYNKIIPNGADRILAMAEQQQLHRQFMEKSVVEGDIRRSDRGLILGFIVTIMFGAGGIYLVATGHDLNGLAVIFVPLAGLVGTFIYSQNSRRRERKEKSRALSEQREEIPNGESENNSENEN